MKGSVCNLILDVNKWRGWFWRRFYIYCLKITSVFSSSYFLLSKEMVNNANHKKILKNINKLSFVTNNMYITWVEWGKWCGKLDNSTDNNLSMTVSTKWNFPGAGMYIALWKGLVVPVNNTIFHWKLSRIFFNRYLSAMYISIHMHWKSYTY